MRRTTTTIFLAVWVCAAATGCTHDAPVAPTPNGPSLSIGNDADIGSTGSSKAYTLAVIGDTPYGDAKLAEFPRLVALINADPKVEVVLHAGDIKAGSSSPCTDEYFSAVKALFDGFKDPLVYTPGDNEWTDCHVASKNNGLYTPTERLQAVRALFFPVAGQTLGGYPRHVLTEADDPANSAYVENTMWMASDVVFAALNIPGSNNDLAAWGSPLPANAANYPSQAQERASRAQANSAWLEKAFAVASENEAAGVVLLFQADMWDPTAPLSGYDELVQQIGNLAAAFGKPVLLLEGDSHIFRVDQPFLAGSPLFAMHPATPVAENVTRLVVEGSAAGRTEYVRLTVHPKDKRAGLFSFERVPLP
jgi:calcineurin-like phosphoesterase family protein